MQGIIFDIKRFAVHDGPGIRTTVFFKGCPLNCFWCHNPEGLSLTQNESVRSVSLDGITFDQTELAGKSMSVSDIMEIVKKDRLFMEESGGGVTFSGGEPTMQPDFLFELLTECKKEGIHTALDTCGQTIKMLFQRILPLVDLFLFDLKHHDSGQYKKGTGVSNEIILENLSFLLAENKKVRIRIPIIPGYNFSNDDFLHTVALLKSIHGNIEQVDLLPFHNIAKNKYKRFGMSNPMEDIPSLPKSELKEAVIFFEKENFNVKIGG